MSQSNDFLTDEKGDFFQQSFRKTVRQSIIKSEDLAYGQPHKVEAQTKKHMHKEGGNIFPLIEGDEIVGFVFECACGEVAKILFEFDQEIKRVAS